MQQLHWLVLEDFEGRCVVEVDIHLLILAFCISCAVSTSSHPAPAAIPSARDGLMDTAQKTVGSFMNGQGIFERFPLSIPCDSK